MNKFVFVCATVLMWGAASAQAQYSGSIFGPTDVDNGNAISGLAGSTQAATQNGNIRYQWRIVPTTAGDNRWLGFEWDSRTKVFGFIGNPTFTPNNNVIIDGGMDIRYNNNPGNFRINSVETGKRLIFNITDVGNNLATAPGDDQIAFALTEINHSASLASIPDGAATGLSNTRSGNDIILQTSSTAENSGSNEELWYQWTQNDFTTKNLVQDTGIGANDSITIPLSASAPILREGDTLKWIVASTGPSSTGTITGTTRGLLNFDVIAINKSTVVTYGPIADDDSTAPVLSAFSITSKTDAEILAGGWTISGSIQDSGSGVNDNGATVTTTNFSPNFDILNNANTVVVSDQLFTTRPADGTTTLSTLSASAPAFASSSIDLGTYKIRVSATDNDEDPSTATSDRTPVIDSQVATFTVSDDDTTGPAHSSFTGEGVALQGASYLDDGFPAHGLQVTGFVQDAQSGVFGGSSNTYVLTRNGTQVGSGALSAQFSDGQALGTPGRLEVAISKAVIEVPGVYTMRVVSVNFDTDRGSADISSTTSDFVFTVTVNAQPAIGRGPSSLSYTAMVGSSPASQSFYVTNVGGGTLTYNVTTNYNSGSGWLSASPGAGNLIASASQTHTVGINVNTMAAGSYSATLTIDGNQTNVAQTVSVSLSLTNIPSVESFTATADGNQMIRLATSDSSGRQVLIAYRQGTDLSADPVNGTAYSVGSSLGSGTVVYKGAAGNFEHVVAAGATHYYRAYMINNDHYSLPDSESPTTGSYGASERVETFSYTNATGLQTRNGGANWSGAWTISVPRTNTDIVVENINFATFQSVWPSESGNRLNIKTTNSFTYEAFRSMSTITSGKIYFGGLYRRQFNEGVSDAKFSGISLMNGSTEVAFIGERGAGNDQFGARSGNNGTLVGAADSFASGVDRLIIGCYDFSDGSLKAIYYNSGDAVPSSEPTYLTTATDTPASQITGIRLSSGATSGWNGETHFDEIRVATSWKALMNIPAPDIPVAFSAAGGTLQNTLTFTKNAANDPVVIVYNATGTFTDPSGTPPSIGQSFAGGTLLYNGATSPQTHSGLTAGETVYYKAFSYDSAGPAYSDGLTANATTVPAAPATAAASSIDYTSFTANWNAATGASSYRLDVSSDPTFATTLTGFNNLTVTGTSQSVSIPGSDNKIGQYYYRVRAVNGSGTSTNSATRPVGTSIPNGVNGGGTPPSATVVAPSTIYVGDTGSFSVKAWGTLNGNFARHRVVIDTDPNIYAGGIRGSFTGFDNVELSTATSPQFTSAGTWYWAMQFDYGSPYGTNIWMSRNFPDWGDLQYAGTNGNLTVTVTALSDPTGVSATKDGTLPAEKINLAWTKWNGRDVMVVRSLDATFTAPTPGQTYTAGNSIGGDTVVYKGAGTNFADTGLSASTTYYYRYYSENSGYYSTGADANETTDASPAPDAPVATAASSATISGFNANWNASAGATSYRLDVSSNATFTAIHPSYNNLNVGNVTTYAVTGLPVGPYFYRVRAVNGGGTSLDSNTIGTGTTTGQGRNKNGVSPPYYRNLSSVTNGTIYVGETITVGADLWGQVNGQNGAGRAVIRTTTTLSGGSYGSWGSADSVEYTEAVTPKFTSAGTWYWGIQMSYGTAGTNFWLVKNDNNWHDQYYAGTNGTIAVTVTALSDPTGVSATQNGGSPQSAIDLAWTKWNSRDVMVVRSLDASFGTPAADTVYSAGQTIAGDTVVYKGSGTSFSDTGLGAGTTYYYRFYSENFGFYSAGADANATTAGTAPSAPTANAATSVGTTSFQANWSTSAGATGYRLDVANDIGFTSLLGSYNNLNVNNVTAYSVSGLTAGNTYYYRVRAYNGAGTSGSSSTITVTLPASATVVINEIPPASGTEGTLTWEATVGASYDVYKSDDDGATWNYLETVVADTSMESTTVSEDAKRHFKVVIAGASASGSSSPVWGVIKPTIPSGYSLMAAPLDMTDLTLFGEYGTALKSGLTGDNGGGADKIMIRESNGTWTERFVNGSGNWSANYTFAEGQGFYMYRSGAPVEQRYDGPVGNNGVGSRAISSGWNIIGPSQGKDRTFSQVTTALAGTPAGGWEESTADLIVVDEGNGNFRRIMKYNGSPAWLDLKTFTSPTITITPGQGVYYLKQSGSGVTAINF